MKQTILRPKEPTSGLTLPTRQVSRKNKGFGHAQRTQIPYSFSANSKILPSRLTLGAIALVIILLIGLQFCEAVLAQADLTTKERIAAAVAEESLAREFNVFNLAVIFFVTLGPLKVIPVFAQLTAKANAKRRWQLALRSTVISTIVILLVSIIGQTIRQSWTISLPALIITAGILLFTVAFKLVMNQYEADVKIDAPSDDPPLKLAVQPLAFPTILTPFGIAIALTIMAMVDQITAAGWLVLVLLVLTMVLNFVSMILARPILTFIRPVTLRIFGFTIGVLQLALGIEYVMRGIEIEALAFQQLLGL
jgi:multiple antibiotic resistance protein